MVTVSQEAAEKIVELRRQDGLTENFSVRVAVKGGGCSGLMYDLNFASEPQAGDMIFEDKGVTVMIDKKSILYLAGTELQYSGGLNGKGFVFHNPNASRTCGCGESFAV
ncbi:iron-sulfur cluster assembly accessory protein [Siphonobacter sp. BAB-5385]|uniref:Iron-sulfur cluster assembly accessory protein n=1 Tax=Siphonobacter curvatus TaxID=2094562 RepID=A0A2S7IN77_9BACT|nr:MULTISPECIES: iron-sulfur cluster assembly accessory protein [Siphonobacter]OZI09859.1 iron-sulfur cluster assembly accessory protein [Siphonobacter sp. BAB-5385]PMD97660.1 iron-sulfur cluster assembly accessory protein [Siphonobacter sp. BAB-5405]PQA59184.1 iron-sulfur cluster assembly accessory protein [Siphonobacter curvatus]